MYWMESSSRTFSDSEVMLAILTGRFATFDKASRPATLIGAGIVNKISS
jgi:hypothetical protein